MRSLQIIILALLVLLVSACSPTPVCPREDTATHPTLDLVELHGLFPTPGPTPTPSVIEISGKTISVDRIIKGPLCNDTWSGIVYVTCDVRVASWEEHPTFLDGCELEIATDTVVYVAAHNDAPYYKGCSCHYSDDSMP